MSRPSQRYAAWRITIGAVGQPDARCQSLSFAWRAVYAGRMDIPDARTETTVTEDATWAGASEASVTVASGATLAISGSLDGHLTIESLGTVLVSGDVVGPVDVRVAGTLIIETGGRVSGTIRNFGSITNYGLRAGWIEGRDPDDQPGSEVLPAASSNEPTPHRLVPRD